MGLRCCLVEITGGVNLTCAVVFDKVGIGQALLAQVFIVFVIDLREGMGK